MWAHVRHFYHHLTHKLYNLKILILIYCLFYKMKNLENTTATPLQSVIYFIPYYNPCTGLQYAARGQQMSTHSVLQARKITEHTLLESYEIILTFTFTMLFSFKHSSDHSSSMHWSLKHITSILSCFNHTFKVFLENPKTVISVASGL